MRFQNETFWFQNDTWMPTYNAHASEQKSNELSTLHFWLYSQDVFKLYNVTLKEMREHIRDDAFRAGGDIIKVEFMHTKRTNCLTKMKIGIHLEKLK